MTAKHFDIGGNAPADHAPPYDERRELERASRAVWSALHQVRRISDHPTAIAENIEARLQEATLALGRIEYHRREQWGKGR